MYIFMVEQASETQIRHCSYQQTTDGVGGKAGTHQHISVRAIQCACNTNDPSFMNFGFMLWSFDSSLQALHFASYKIDF